MAHRVEQEPGADRYTTTAVSLHWLMALLIFGALALGLTMVELPLSPLKLKLFSYHKWLGVTIFLFAVLRLLWRATHPAPGLPGGMPKWQRAAARLTHGGLYAVFFAMPLSGWLMSSAEGFPVVYLGLLPLPNLVAKDKALAGELAEVHETLAYALVVLLLLHVVAALKHHFVDRDDVLRRMVPFLKTPPRRET